MLYRKALPKYWFFNSKKEKPLILMKNSDKINNIEICKTLIGIKNKDYAFDSVSTLHDYLKESPDANKRKIAHAVLTSGLHKDYTAVELCKTFIENKVLNILIGLNMQIIRIIKLY